MTYTGSAPLPQTPLGDTRPHPAALVPDDRNSDTAATLRAILNGDLDFHGSPGKYATHGWHSFPAKFPPQLPRVFIEALSAPGETVLDPMAGSGTTLVEAQRLGRQPIGCDIDPLARLIASAKLTAVDVAEATQAGREVLIRAQREYSTHRPRLTRDLKSRFDQKTGAFIDYWFRPQQQLELVALLRSMEALADDSLGQFLRVVLSSTIIAKSGGVSMARDLAHTRPHRVLDKEPKSAFAEFAKRLTNNLSGEQQARFHEAGKAPPRGAGLPARILATSAEATGLAKESTDLIVTSPPYANGAIDYMRAHKFSLVWLGWSVTDLTDLRGRYLGHDAMSRTASRELPDQCEKTLSELSRRDERKASVLRRYFSEMASVIAEMQRVLRSGRAGVMVVGTSVLRSLDVETHKGLAAIGEAQGLNLAGIGVRRLDRDKRMMPARWGNKRASQIEERMHDEYVIGFVKP